MPSEHSSTPARPEKPAKPYPDFPLSPGASGKWCKRIRGHLRFFGRWYHTKRGRIVLVKDGGWKEALREYEAVAADLHAGRTPRVKSADGLTVADLCNRFLTAKMHKLNAGELDARTFQGHRGITDLLVASFGKDRLVDDLAADDFQALRATMAERWGPTRLGNSITSVKGVFKFAVDNALMASPPRYGSEFKKPERSVLRRHRAAGGSKMLEPADLRRLIDAAGTSLRAMMLLGLNAGFGNNDCSSLPLSAVDLGGAATASMPDSGWVDFPRPKTGIARRCSLWPETTAAIRAVLAERPEPKDPADADLVFLQRSGRRWVRNTPKSRTDNVSVQFMFLLKAQALYREGIGFYTLRHVFRTVADAARDPVAIDLVMGHADPSMGGHYRERIDDARLLAVSEHVHAWLFGVSDAPHSAGKETEQPKGSHAPAAPSAPAADDRPRLRLFAG
jgi:integrase